MTRAFVAVGSNVRPARNVRAALRALASRVSLKAVSTVYRTKAEGRPGQPDFYNCVVELETDLSPQSLKSSVLRRIESDLGRRRTADKFAPRTIDLDLILYGELILNTQTLTLPDPQIPHRAFLAIPLTELAPDLKLPGTRVRIAKLASHLPQDRMRPLPGYTARLRAGLAAVAEADRPWPV